MLLHGLLCSLLRILKDSLHIADTGDELQHLGVKGVELFALLQCALFLGEVHDDSCHARHRLAQVVTGRLYFLTLLYKFANDGLLLFPQQTDTVHALFPHVDDDDKDEGIDTNHPPLEEPRTCNNNLNDTLLIADCSFGTDGFNMELISAW